MIRLPRDNLFAADIAALERLAQSLGCAAPTRWRTERERKAKIVEAIERAEKALQREHGGGQGPRRRM